MIIELFVLGVIYFVSYSGNEEDKSLLTVLSC